MVAVVPIKIEIAQSAGNRGFSDLSRSAHKEHLAVILEVIFSDRPVNSRSVFHESIMVCIPKWSMLKWGYFQNGLFCDTDAKGETPAFLCGFTEF